MNDKNNGHEHPVRTILPAVDIIEKERSYVVAVDLPGANRDEIKAHIENNTLTITAPMAVGGIDAGQSDVMGEYRREFSLADDIDAATVDATYDLGVLTVTFGKKQQYQPKTISIN